MQSDVQVIKQYGSHISSIRCNKCGTARKFYSYQLPRTDFQVHCKKCDNNFLVRVEKRKKFRLKTRMTVSFSKWGDPREVTNCSIGNIVNLSVDGFCIDYYGSPKEFKPGDTIYFSFVLPDLTREEINNAGIIKWVKRTNPNNFGQKLLLGVQFSDLDMHQRKALGFFLMGETNRNLNP